MPTARMDHPRHQDEKVIGRQPMSASLGRSILRVHSQWSLISAGWRAVRWQQLTFDADASVT